MLGENIPKHPSGGIVTLIFFVGLGAEFIFNKPLGLEISDSFKYSIEVPGLLGSREDWSGEDCVKKREPFDNVIVSSFDGVVLVGIGVLELFLFVKG